MTLKQVWPVWHSVTDLFIYVFNCLFIVFAYLLSLFEVGLQGKQLKPFTNT